ncbi:hypothetical protein [Hoeflea sp. TYP-13]|uniref:hypothetical protein n=1 Tax=Hoeflea sp. TYP-13 TaxID=3230023 RepID=UPI0034C61A55
MSMTAKTVETGPIAGLVAETVSHCCADKLAKSRTAAPCSVDCSFLPASSNITVLRALQDYDEETYAPPPTPADGRLHRPPIV